MHNDETTQKWLDAIRREYEPVVSRTIQNVLRGSYLNQDFQDVLNSLWLWTFEHRSELLAIADPVELSKRLRKRAWWVARSARQTRIRERKRFANGVDLKQISNEPDGSNHIDKSHDRTLSVRSASCSLLNGASDLSTKTTVSPVGARLLCGRCQVLRAVTSESGDGVLGLVCGHSRTREDTSVTARLVA